MGLGIIMSIIIPILLVMIWIYIKDKYEREPILNILKYFFMGIIVSIVALNIEKALINISIKDEHIIYESFIVAGFTEEILKFIFLMILINKDKNYTEKLDGIIYSVCLTLGFAMIENIMYVMSENYFKYEVSMARSLISVPGHIIFATIMGYYISEYKFSDNKYKRRENIIMAIFIPIIVHGLFDALLIIDNKISVGIFMIYLVFLLKISLDMIDRNIHLSRRKIKMLRRRRR